MNPEWEDYATGSSLVLGFLTLRIYPLASRSGWHLSLHWLGKEVVANRPLGDIPIEKAKKKAAHEVRKLFEQAAKMVQDFQETK